MSKVLGFMKQVARGLQVEGNFGTAHVYRSSLNAIIAYRGKDDFAFNEVTSEWLKGFEVYLRSRGVAGIRFLPIFVPFVPFTIVPSIFIGHHTFRICSVRCIRALVPIINVPYATTI